MDIHTRLLALVTESTTPSSALTSTARLIGEELLADACTIFVLGSRGHLVPRANFGRPATPAVSQQENVLAEQALADVLARTAETTTEALVAVPVAAINRGIGAIVARRSPSMPFTAEEVMRLSGVASQLVELVGAVLVVDNIARSKEPAAVAPAPVVRDLSERTLEGIAASPGIAIGAATVRVARPRALAPRSLATRDPAVERSRVRDGIEKALNDLVRMQSSAASAMGEEQALVFGAHLLVLRDPMLTELVDTGIQRGLDAATVIDEAFDELRRLLRDAPDAYVQERVEDIEDLRDRIMGHLVGAEERSELEASIVVSLRTLPSLILESKARGAVGIISQLGGATSHGVLLARSFGIPAVTGIADLTEQLCAGDEVIVDGDAGRVVVRPNTETRAVYEKKRRALEREWTEFARYRDKPACTADGLRFALQANIALAIDLDVARENGADGVGLYRTEFPFIVRDALPTVEEQARIYAKAYEAFPSKPVTLRLLDLAGDKFVASRQFGVSRDAFHGYRSIRILFDYPHVLRDQVRAFALAAAGRDLRILIPMVTSVAEVLRTKAMVETSLAMNPACAVRVSWGAMIETPASVELVTDLAREVDFFSIGTNDLVQYTLVVDREDPRMASERHVYHPAILRMIGRVTAAARAAGRPVGVCGEMAARPDLALVLLALGVDSLSVTARLIPELKRDLARANVGPLRGSLSSVLALSSAEELERALRRHLSGEASSVH